MKKLFYTTRLLFWLLILWYTFASDSQFLELKSFKTIDGKEYFSKNWKDNFKQWSEFQKESSALSSDSIRNPTIVKLNGKSLCVAYWLEQETMKECSWSTEAPVNITDSNTWQSSCKVYGQEIGCSKLSSCSTYREDGYTKALYDSLTQTNKNIFVVCWMYDNKMTAYSTIKSFQGDSLLRRDASTKIFYNFITNALSLTPKTISWICNYSDLKSTSSEISGYIKKSCNIWLYKWSNTNKNFYPKENLKKWRFATIMSNTLTVYNLWEFIPLLNDIKEIKNKDEKITRLEAAHALYKLSIIIKNWDWFISEEDNILSSLIETGSNNNTVINCWTTSTPISDTASEKAQNCMDTKLTTCSPAKLTTLILDPTINPFTDEPKKYYKATHEILGYKNSVCLVKFTYIKSQIADRDNKSMICEYDTSKTIVENGVSFYSNNTCSGSLYDIMSI